jgi:hypothetical protein
MKNNIYFRVSYTYAKAMDDGQDAPFVSPSAVQNSAQPNAERSVSSTDQRQRLATSWVWAPKLFHRDQPVMKKLFNDWTFAGTVTFGTGRPFNARILGDANRDTNSANDRLPGAGRNSAYGPNYVSTDMRLTRRLFLRDRLTVDALLESFNVFNHANKRVDVTDNGFNNVAADFVQGDTTISSTTYPAQFVVRSGFLEPTSAFAARQVQIGLKLKF